MIQVLKRNGTSEDLNLDKIHNVLEWAIQDINDVNISDIEMNAQLSFRDGISTSEIHEILTRSAADLISEENPNYQYVAARLLLFSLRKSVWGESEPPRLLEHIRKCIQDNNYDQSILEYYSESEIHKIAKFVKHERDNSFTYSGLQQLIDKYLVKNRKTGQVYETPQFAYILIAMTLFRSYKKDRIKYIKRAYDYFSKFKISMSTPVMAGVRTNMRSFTSCNLLNVDDNMDSILSNVQAVGQLIARRAGIGLNMGKIRAIGSEVRGGDVIHTGVIPFLKVFESLVKSCAQGGLRKGSATVNFPFWHYEIEDIIVLKNNAGTDENRVRHMDYCIQFSKLFYDRVREDKDITLFSPHEVPELYKAFGTSEFDEVYEKCERKHLKQKKKIKARDLLEKFTIERLETGRIYIMNIDHCNNWPWNDKVEMTNLCVEILHCVKPLSHIDDENAEIGCCLLSGINILETKPEEMQDVCDIVVRMLEELIDIQEYPIKATETFTKNKRSLGIGVTNLAALLAKNKISYSDDSCLTFIDRLFESIQYNLLLASNNLAKEKGKCKDFASSCYSNFEFPFEKRVDYIDELVPHELEYPWEELRESIKSHGLRHTTLSCVFPSESSSVVQNATNGIEPPRMLLSYKKSKTGILPQLVPNYQKYKKFYTTAFRVQNSRYSEIGGIILKWFDMAVSLNHYYDYEQYNGQIPISELVKDMFYHYKCGNKTLYYTNSKDTDEESGCESGACSL